MFLRKHAVDTAVPVTVTPDLPAGPDLLHVEERLRGLLCEVSDQPGRNGL